MLALLLAACLAILLLLLQAPGEFGRTGSSGRVLAGLLRVVLPALLLVAGLLLALLILAGLLLTVLAALLLVAGLLAARFGLLRGLAGLGLAGSGLILVARLQPLFQRLRVRHVLGFGRRLPGLDRGLVALRLVRFAVGGGVGGGHGLGVVGLGRGLLLGVLAQLLGAAGGLVGIGRLGPGRLGFDHRRFRSGFLRLSHGGLLLRRPGRFGGLLLLPLGLLGSLVCGGLFGLRLFLPGLDLPARLLLLLGLDGFVLLRLLLGLPLGAGLFLGLLVFLLLFGLLRLAFLGLLLFLLGQDQLLAVLRLLVLGQGKLRGDDGQASHKRGCGLEDAAHVGPFRMSRDDRKNPGEMPRFPHKHVIAGDAHRPADCRRPDAGGI
ncbi:hypothetical protein [Paracoccus sp. DMF]|uniref:hypothetical protein n=1 Tax=Paracoccus sp. DMF TaxID=400837 RepID=UPI0021E3BC2F|nr:hypothetical protein [Paracoccus sp. DMF]MCV2446512.1 hypothetical protein [Paracoccus sp. DMF]